MNSEIKEEKELVESEEEIIVETEETIDEVAVLQAECTKLQDKLLRNTAELENFKRRTNEEKQNFMKYATQGVMLELVEIVDNYERALTSLEGSVDENVCSGIEMIYKQLNNVLANHGVEKIETVGNIFDPNLHQAVMTGVDENYESGYVIEEFQKGYKMKDKILRPAMVKVNE